MESGYTHRAVFAFGKQVRLQRVDLRPLDAKTNQQ